MIAIIIGIDHGYYAIKTRQVSFPSGIIGYDYEPYTMQNVLQYQGKYYVCGTGRQTLVKNKTSNDNYYLLTLAAIAEEIKHRKAERKTEVILAVGLPLSSFGREKQGFREYLLRKEQPVRFLYESELYEITIKDVKLFPQGYSALALHPEYLKNEPSVLLVDIGGWTVDLMRLDNAVPNAATCRSLELGVIRCIDETAEQVRRNTGLSVTETQIERVLRGESCSMAEEARRIIQENGRKYIERILSAVTESGFDLRAVPTVFMGGGSAILKRHVTAAARQSHPFFSHLFLHHFLLVDIGGWTVDLMRLDNAVPNAATCRSLELGVIRCIDETAEQVRRNTGLSVTETQIERVLRRESCSMAEEARRIIQENGRKYIERILSAVTESGFDLRAVPTVFMGGGSAILKRHVTAQDAICRPVFIEDVHANATGYERIVEQMWTR